MYREGERRQSSVGKNGVTVSWSKSFRTYTGSSGDFGLNGRIPNGSYYYGSGSGVHCNYISYKAGRSAYTQYMRGIRDRALSNSWVWP